MQDLEADGRQASAVLLLVRETLREELVGACLHGSAVLGGLRPDSDLDLLVVSRRRLRQDERVSLLDGLLDVSGRRARRVPGRPVELTVVVDAEVDPWRYPPQVDFLYGEWLRTDYEGGLVPAPHADPDLAVLLTVARAGDAALHGPPPRSVLPAVPRADVEQAMAAGVPDLLAQVGSDTRNVLLTLARIWTTLATGLVVSKDRAADWVLDRLPADEHRALALARDAYLGRATDDWVDLEGQVLAASHRMTEAITQLRVPQR